MNRFYTAKEVGDILRVSESKAYCYIRQMNAELEKAGYLTVRGKIPAAYLQKRFFGAEGGNNADSAE